MKKKHRCSFNRFAALVAVLFLSCSLMLPFAFAASDTEADMPSLADFYNHHGSWYVWRKVTISSIDCYELLCSPIEISGSSYTLPYSVSYSTNAFNVNYLANDSGTSYYYACAYPYPLRGASGLWSELPSFPVGYGISALTSVVRVYSTSSVAAGTYGFLTSASSSFDRSLTFSNSSSGSSASSTDSLSSFAFSSPFYSYPFAFRQTTSSSSSGYALMGGDSSFVVPPSNYLSRLYINLNSNRLLLGTSSFVPYPSGYTIPSSNIGFVFVSKPSNSYVTSASDFNASGSFAFSLLVPASRLLDVKVGDWISDSPEDLQDAITNDFGVDSGKLKDSKNSITDWSNTSSIDSDASTAALGFFGGIAASGLMPCLLVVVLLCFGAIVLRMLLRKALD